MGCWVDPSWPVVLNRDYPIGLMTHSSKLGTAVVVSNACHTDVN